MKLSNLSKTYGGKKVLDIKTFSFLSDYHLCRRPGPNGSGKSTFGRIAAGDFGA
jgi:ABC-type multidrug transport system ATPase subunit